MERSSGIIAPLFSLPSPYGIGSLGAAAYEWIDFLAAAKQSWWQLLPVGPTSYGDSPYQSPSTFAGNHYLIDLDLLVQDGLLETKELMAVEWGNDPARVDYQALYEHRLSLLALACERGWQRDAEKIARFAQENATWLDDYALFMAVKRHFGMVAWTDWPDEAIRLHDRKACETYRIKLASDVRLFVYTQYLFFQQWEELRRYAHKRGVGIIGDLPIYVAMDSADVWAEPANFQLDELNVPTFVAGVPPDNFSATGQLWGNPLYDYEAMEADGFGWWRRRAAGAARLFDVIRIDHFRGIESYWAVPYGATTTKGGHWVKGPGIRLVHAIKSAIGDCGLIAEDLGYLTTEVRDLLAQSALPGMKIMQFAFDSRDQDNAGIMLEDYPQNCVCYVGSHDNAPIVAWAQEVQASDLAAAIKYLKAKDESDLPWAFVRAGMASKAQLFMAQIQDYLGLGADSRINSPGILGDNWQWRLVPGQLSQSLAAHIADLTTQYERSVQHSWQQ